MLDTEHDENSWPEQGKRRQSHSLRAASCPHPSLFFQVFLSLLSCQAAEHVSAAADLDAVQQTLILFNSLHLTGSYSYTHMQMWTLWPGCLCSSAAPVPPASRTELPRACVRQPSPPLAAAATSSAATSSAAGPGPARPRRACGAGSAARRFRLAAGARSPAPRSFAY